MPVTWGFRGLGVHSEFRGVTAWAFGLRSFGFPHSVGWLESQTRNDVLLVFSLADHYHERLCVSLTTEGLVAGHLPKQQLMRAVARDSYAM